MDTLLAPLLPLFAVLIPSLAAAWIANRWLRTRADSQAHAARLDALESEVELLRQSNAELQERADFAERLLQQVRDGLPALPPPAGGRPRP
jgi:hypothetical protein